MKITPQLFEHLRPRLPEEVARCTELSKSPQCWSRHHFEPGHFTASAFVLHPSESSILLIKHKKLGFWLQPGGHIHAEDGTVERAARRELVEETGVAALNVIGKPGIPFDIDIHQIPTRPNEPAHLHFDLRFAYRATMSGLRAQEEEVDGIEWAPLKSLNHVDTDASVRRSAQLLNLRDI